MIHGELLGLSVVHLGIGGHGHWAPHAGAALDDLGGQLVHGGFVAGVLGSDVLVDGPTSFLSTVWQAMQFLAVASAWSANAGAATAVMATAMANRARFIDILVGWVTVNTTRL
jgi:hypothetical protein